MKKYILITFLAILISSCAYNGTTFKDNNRKLSAPYADPKVYYNGKNIIVIIKQTPGFNLAKISTDIFDGYLYLDPLYISSGGGGNHTFVFNIEKDKLNKDWINKVYWITGKSFPAPISWFDVTRDHQRTIYRKRIKILKK